MPLLAACGLPFRIRLTSPESAAWKVRWQAISCPQVVKCFGPHVHRCSPNLIGEVLQRDRGGVVFHEPTACPYHDYEPGSQSPAGDLLRPLLKSLVSHGGLYGEGR